MTRKNIIVIGIYLCYGYALSAIVQIDREIMDRKLSRRAAVLPAVAYKLGTAVMGDYSDKYQILGLEHEDDTDYKLAMGIGDGPLVLNVGTTWRAGNQFWTSRLYEPLTEGIRMGPVLPKAEIPATIPSL